MIVYFGIEISEARVFASQGAHIERGCFAIVTGVITYVKACMFNGFKDGTCVSIYSL